jgi:3-hydroxyacyl-CoA dehydrogenase
MTDAVLREAYPWHGPLSVIVSRLVERGCLGQKTGAGVYRYEAGDRTPLASTVCREIIEEVRGEAGEAAGASRGVGIVDRLMLRMVAEAFRVVEEAVVDRPADVDVAMVLGTGLADFRGGVLKYACDVGADRVLDQLQRLAGECGERYAPCDLLRAAAADHHAMGRLLGLTQRAGSLA